MPAPKVSTPPPPVTAGQAAEVLDGFLGGRTGWKSTDRGWSHKKTGLTVVASGGSCPFTVTTTGQAGDRKVSRTGLELMLHQVGA